MTENKILIIILSLMLVLGISFTLFCCERKASYPQETLPIVTDPLIEETTESIFIPSPEPPTTIPVETEATTEPIVESTTPVITRPIPTEPIEESTPPATTTPPTEPTVEITPPTTEQPLPEGKYPEATYIWNYLTQTLGYNNYVAAGILGNIMVEVGGGTLAINPTLYSYGNKYYYGICQWNKGTFSEIHGAPLEQQVEFLGSTMLRQFGTQARLDDFLSSQDARRAAIMFNTWYERGHGPDARANCAEIAYNYFVNETA